MNRSLWKLALLAMLASAAGPAIAQTAQAKVRADRSNLIESQIALGFDYPPIARKAFLSAPVIPLPKGTVLPTRGVVGPLGMDRMLTLRQQDFAIGTRTLRYPVIGMMRCSNFPYTGEFVMVIASTTLIHENVKSGEVLHTGGFLLQARRAFRAGEKLASVRVLFQQKQFFFSIEEAPEATGAAPQPLLSIVQEHRSAADLDVALEAWRLSNQSAREGGLN